MNRSILTGLLKFIAIFHKYLRGFDCGMTSLGFDEFTQKITELGKNEFAKKNYKLFDNNCRDFCSHLIFNVLKPSKMEICECESSNRFVITRK